ncbi:MULTISPECIES: hypothetical protein [unclassified Mesorhizobium]|uniref:hypothetical protein n=1 Tax=unclassified Mesorhizobium TaxID=325217 RepID=UPI001093D973|nr:MULTISPECIES: hypothetical protein [unclassified Mesorhizobium]TGQ72967.1 hypothetical protein EN848_06495 [bacterium M00.F.Ca.ET.205.01.1.1]TGU53723.1 hypothetical protein EN795_10915 [bacterium M00.F.Ca.ET.152.01.1.1]TGV37223.1 hypothetical protein EN829_010940 [Mesorhizobium sp. M00.F.Ca.ET.186.01.1.1]TGW06484.1 hypothetical protein EN788_41885 [Mesorhizobium sp. M2D.F.Ca.ET.145.01.1.1]TGZ39409.1 hypothetical protein EN805_29075 [bacterium M00.F.Ca.ET.162.01.1.1]
MAPDHKDIQQATLKLLERFVMCGDLVGLRRWIAVRSRFFEEADAPMSQSWRRIEACCEAMLEFEDEHGVGSCLDLEHHGIIECIELGLKNISQIMVENARRRQASGVNSTAWRDSLNKRIERGELLHVAI